MMVRGGGGPKTIQLSLVQKPTRKFQKKLEFTLRNLKTRGFNLYQKAKKETEILLHEFREMMFVMKQEQKDALAKQDEMMKIRVEGRLTEI